jgi:hypothetical protein
MRKNMKMNDQVNRDAASVVPTSETADGGSGSTHGSFSAITFTQEEVIGKIKEWVESHNTEFKWNWNDLKSVRTEMINCGRLSGTCEIIELLDTFK